MKQEALIVARLCSSSQVIVLRPRVLKHIGRYRQTKWWQREAGGQLFGLVTDKVLHVELATGPYQGDLRSRYNYRSHPGLAQREILRQRELGLYYCGDWHTHPEPRPTASDEDMQTISTLAKRSDLRLNCVVMLIQGAGMGADGLAVYSSDGSAPVKWSISNQ